MKETLILQFYIKSSDSSQFVPISWQDICNAYLIISLPSGKVFLNTIEYMDGVHEEWTTMLPANLSTEEKGEGAPEQQPEKEADEVKPEAVEVSQEASEVKSEVKDEGEEKQENQNGVTTPDSPSAQSPCGNWQIM